MKKTAKIAGKTIVGIDYGNKYAGTTVICYNSRHKIKFVQSSKMLHSVCLAYTGWAVIIRTIFSEAVIAS
jgi:hypothetical protein